MYRYKRKPSLIGRQAKAIGRQMGGPVLTFNLWDQTFDIMELPNISNARDDSITYRIGF